MLFILLGLFTGNFFFVLTVGNNSGWLFIRRYDFCRSVKPENILFDSLGHLKLSGFGSASRITKDGTVSSPLQVEEASYEAPEILRTLGNTDFIYGHLCDFWSIGVIAYETVFQEHPFKDTSSLATFKKITLPKVLKCFVTSISNQGSCLHEFVLLTAKGIFRIPKEDQGIWRFEGLHRWSSSRTGRTAGLRRHFMSFFLCHLDLGWDKKW